MPPTLATLRRQLHAIGRRAVALQLELLRLIPRESDAPPRNEAEEVADAIDAIDLRGAEDFTLEEIDDLADLGFDAIDRGLVGWELEASMAAAIDQVLADRRGVINNGD